MSMNESFLKLWRTARTTEASRPHPETGMAYAVRLCTAPQARLWYFTLPHVKCASKSGSDVPRLYCTYDSMFSWISLLALEMFSSTQTQGINRYLHQLVWLVKWVKDFSFYPWVVHKIDAMRICIKFSYTWRDLPEIRVAWANVLYTPGILNSNPYSANHLW